MNYELKCYEFIFNYLLNYHLIMDCGLLFKTSRQNKLRKIGFWSMGCLDISIGRTLAIKSKCAVWLVPIFPRRTLLLVYVPVIFITLHL